MLLGELDILSARFGVKRKDDMSVVVCCGGWIFSHMTGLDAGTAGVFDPRSETFYFQDPSALSAKGILAGTVRHECMHYIIHCARNGRNGNDNRWLEESFCLALFPVAVYPDAVPPAGLTGIAEFRDYLNRNLESGEKGARRQAYALAYMWGCHIIRNMGECVIFRALTGRDAAVDWEGQYGLMRKK